MDTRNARERIRSRFIAILRTRTCERLFRLTKRESGQRTLFNEELHALWRAGALMVFASGPANARPWSINDYRRETDRSNGQ
jgi:hypothetical protein